MRHYRHAHSRSQATFGCETKYGQRGFPTATNDGLFNIHKFGSEALQVRWVKNLAVVWLGPASASTTPIFHTGPRVGYSSIPATKKGSLQVAIKQGDKFSEIAACLALCRTGRRRLRLMSTWTGEYECNFGRMADFEMDRVLQCHESRCYVRKRTIEASLLWPKVELRKSSPATRCALDFPVHGGRWMTAPAPWSSPGYLRPLPRPTSHPSMACLSEEATRSDAL